MANRRFRLLVLLLVLVPIVCFIGGLFRFAHRVQSYVGRTQIAFSQLPKKDLPREVIVVLTGDRRRIPKALELLRLRPTPVLVISGAGTLSLKEVVNQQGDSAVNIHEIWKKIRLESISSSTIENAQETGKILRPLAPKQVVLVTSEYHMVRALEIFKKVLPEYEYYDYPVHSDVSHLLNFQFSTRSLNGLWYLSVEYIKYLLYSFYSSRFLLPL